jgi:heme A synthase
VNFSKLTRFAQYAWAVLAFNFATILWGVYVRASGSGAGCGAHWPLCNGQVIPLSTPMATLIEFVHRITSGLTVLLVVGLVVWAWRSFPARHPVRFSSAFAVFFVFTEALVGAGLVLLELVAKDASLTRAISIMVHLVNTFLLLASVTLTAWWSTDRPPEGFYWRGTISTWLSICLFMVMVLGASGAVTALGDTLFPSKSLSEGFQQDLLPTANFLIRLRIIHPMLAVATALITGAAAYWLYGRFTERRVQIFSLAVMSLLGVQIALGVVNIALLAPIWMQLIHLLVSDFVWLSLVLLASVVFGTVNLLPRLAHQHIHDRVDNPERVS